VQPCDIAHLDTWEANDVEYTVEDVKAARTNPETKAKEWLVSWQGYAVDADSWIQDSQMNDLLRAEAEERKDELWAEGKRMAKLEKSTLGHRQRNKDRRKSNKTSARGH
jgi:hypothetical protein